MAGLSAMVIFPIDVSNRTLFQDSVDEGPMVADDICGDFVSDGIIVMVPVFDSTLTWFSCCWVQPAENMIAAMSRPVRMNNLRDDIGIPVVPERK